MLVSKQYCSGNESNIEGLIQTEYELPSITTEQSFIRLDNIPAAHTITLPNINLLSRPGEDAINAPLLTKVYQRLSQRVQSHDSCTADLLIGGATYVVVLGSTISERELKQIYYDESNGTILPDNGFNKHNRISTTLDNEESLKIQPYELYPLTTSLDINNNKIHESVWSYSDEKTSRPIYDNMNIWSESFRGYQLKQTQSKWFNDIVKGEYEVWNGLKLFGKHNNALTPIVKLAGLMDNIEQKEDKAHNLLLHAVAMICFQYYLMEKGRWLELIMDPTEPFYEDKTQEFFLFFPRYDIKKNHYPIPTDEWKLALQSDEGLANLTRKYDFVTFFVNVMLHIYPTVNGLWKISHMNNSYKQLNREIIETWSSSKLFNNFNLTLVTSRFGPIYVRNYDQYCIASVASHTNNMSSFNGTQWMCLTTSKHFASPNNNGLFQYTLGKKVQLNNHEKQPDRRVQGISDTLLYQVRIPFPYTHFHFNAVNAIFQFPSKTTTTDFNVKPLTPPKSDLTAEQCRNIVTQECKNQDIVLFELAKCLDQKSLNETKSELNKAYKLWYMLFKSIFNTKPKPRHTSQYIQQHQQAQPALVLQDENEIKLNYTLSNAVVKPLQIKPNKKRKPTSDPTVEVDDKGSLRPVYKPPIDIKKINLVRARYSYIINKETNTLCVGVNKFLDWHDNWDIEPETSVNFITPRVWNWLIESGKTGGTEVITKQIKTVSAKGVKSLDYIFPATNSDINVIYKYHTQNAADGTYNISMVGLDKKNGVQLKPYTMEYDCVYQLLKYRATRDFTNVKINWYIVFYAFIVLSNNESKGAYLTFTWCNNLQTTLKLATISRNELLTIIQHDYDQLRIDIKNKMYPELIQVSPVIDALINIAKTSWDRSSLHAFNEDTWYKNTFNEMFIKKYIKERLPDINEIQIWKESIEEKKQDEYDNVTDTEYGVMKMVLTELYRRNVTDTEYGVIKIVLTELYRHLSDRKSTGIYIPAEWKYFRFRFQGSNYMNIQQFNKYFIDLFQPVFIKLSYLFQHLFPASVIVNPKSRQYESLTQARNIAPQALALTYTIAKDIRDIRFIKEVQDLVERKEYIESTGGVFKLPELTDMLYNIVLYQMNSMQDMLNTGEDYQINLTNCVERDRGIEMLKQNLLKICTDSMFAVNQTAVIQHSVQFLISSLRFYKKWSAIPHVLKHIIEELMKAFKTDQVVHVFYMILDEASNYSNEIKTHINYFKESCQANTNDNMLSRSGGYLQFIREFIRQDFAIKRTLQNNNNNNQRLIVNNSNTNVMNDQ